MTTPNDAAEPSLASAGSQPVGWGAVASDGSVVCMMRRRADVASYVVDGTPIVPLYRSPTLTDEEREAIERSIRYWRGGFRPHPFATVLSQLLRRLQQLK
jgi:hypothetical protein